MLINRLRSKYLQNLFNEVWATLPAKQRAALKRRCLLVTDTARFLPPANRHAFGALMSVSVRKSIFILYLNPKRLPQEPADFGTALIANLLHSVWANSTRPNKRVGQITRRGPKPGA